MILDSDCYTRLTRVTELFFIWDTHTAHIHTPTQMHTITEMCL